MPDLEVIFEAVEFIETHLKSTITVGDIAGAIGYSLYHFSRSFNTAVHHTPYDYLMRRRLSESACELVETDKKIIDIALDYQFNNPETYSRAFKRMFQEQPSQCRKRGYIKPQSLMPRLTLAHLEHLDKGPYLRPVLEERESLCIMGLVTLLPSESETLAITQLWAMVNGTLQRLGYTGNCYGIMWYLDNALTVDSSEPSLDSGASVAFYMAGMELKVVSGTEIAGFVQKCIPELKYARFTHKGPLSDMYLTLDYVYHTWLPKSGSVCAYPLVVQAFGPDFAQVNSQDFECKVLVAVG